MHVRSPLSPRNVEDLLHERGIDICHESVSLWGDRFGTYFAHKNRKRRSESMRRSPQWQWHLDEVFVKIRGERHYLWRAVDHEGEVLESFVTEKRDKAAALQFLKKVMKRYGNPHIVVTDRCPSYRAAMKVIGSDGRQETGRHLNNRVENSHLPFRRRGRAMSRFRRMRSLQQFVSINSSVYYHFNFERHINTRIRFKQNRDAALREWRHLLVA
jgi:putative transposase